MYNDRGDYDEILKKAQELGYAEADPTADVGGEDAAAKMAILGSIAFHSRTRLDDVTYEGITGVSALDIAHGKRLGLVAKLLGVAKLIDGRVNVRVYPAFIPRVAPAGRRSPAHTTRSSSRATRSTRSCSTARAPAACRPPRR